MHFVEIKFKDKNTAKVNSTYDSPLICSLLRKFYVKLIMADSFNINIDWARNWLLLKEKNSGQTGRLD